jgi:hypothetical protein
MRFLACLLMAILPITPVLSHAFDLSNLFKPKKKIVQKTPHKHKKAKPSHNDTTKPKPTATPPNPEVRYKGFFVVDSMWMARYRTLEAIWDYEIPEDAEIRYEEGKYLVPPVVFRHYEDMAKTPITSDAQNR